MAMKIRPGFKKFLVVLGVLGVVFGLRTAMQYGLIPTPNIAKALVPHAAILPELKDAKVANVTPQALPMDAPASIASTPIRMEIWEWNAQLGLILANGGPSTTAGSLMAKRNVNLTLVRQDDTNKMQEDLIACAKELQGGQTQCSQGANMVVIMGDGSGQFAAAVNPQLVKLGPAYTVKVIGSTGYSRGEDAFLAPPNVKKDPKSFKETPMLDDSNSPLPVTGLLVEGVLRDGDWNIAMKYLADNNIPNNPDEKTFDPDAVNWINAQDYNTAASDYVSGKKCEDRPVVKNGHLTGGKAHVCVNAVVTWTPGDVTACKQRGGLVKVVSSKQYRSQMPAVILGPAKFLGDNRDEITNMLAAIFEGGDQVKAFDTSLRKSAQISTKIYDDDGVGGKDTSGDFWYTMFKGVAYRDSQGNQVELGGSAVNNLDDNLILFGINAGQNDNFRSTYNVFKTIDEQQYPTLFKETPIPDVKLVEDKSYITGAQAILSGDQETGSSADTVDYTAQAQGDVVSNKAVYIQFNTGQATLTPAGEEQLRQLKDGLAITGLFIKVDGYTDNTGSDTVNVPLSENRADAVKRFLTQTYPGTFPVRRFKTSGHGSQNPIATNATTDGKAQNRRVEITLVGN
jgi:OmpA-OmpF porin, OOP family